MKQIEQQDAPDVGGGIVTGPEGIGCIPDVGYPQWPLAPDPYPDVDHNPMPSDPVVR